MGTRGTITVTFKGRSFRIYNHWDSYPSGLGLQLLKELIELFKTMTLEQMREAMSKMVIIEERDDGKGPREPTPEEIKKLAPYTNLGVSERSTRDWYCLLRGCQGSIKLTLEAGYALSHDGGEEYNYVVDLDNAKLFCEEAPRFTFKLPPSVDDIKRFAPAKAPAVCVAAELEHKAPAPA
jgi:hypothetical protein